MAKFVDARSPVVWTVDLCCGCNKNKCEPNRTRGATDAFYLVCPACLATARGEEADPCAGAAVQFSCTHCGHSRDFGTQLCWHCTKVGRASRSMASRTPAPIPAPVMCRCGAECKPGYTMCWPCTKASRGAPQAL